MIYSSCCGEKISQLGFGTMRLPTKDGAIDEAQVQAMVDYAMEHGVNYFDTAYPYHGGLSEIVIGKCLKKYPRESYFLATKFPGHQIMSQYDPAGVFEEQLQKCGVEYFDFYLLHNVYENSVKTYLDPRWNILEYFREQKRLGRIRHLGFSTHSGIDCLRDFVDGPGKDMEFCQIQLNYMDWTLQNGREKVEILKSRNIPVWVMEPVRGGKLARLTEEQNARLAALRPGETAASWCFRWLQGVEGVCMTLSGMSSIEQMRENVATYEESLPPTACEERVLMELAEGMKDSIPCTACRYCTDGCPMGLNIPELIAMYNDIRYVESFNVGMRVDAMPLEKRPSACIGCGKCARVCPQKIDIPTVMREFADRYGKMKSWTEICKEREEAARRLKAGK